MTNSIILNYDEKSFDLFNWYQQLVAESLGKKGKGFHPIISTMPKDNHSLMQLYLSGPSPTNKSFAGTFLIVSAKTRMTSSTLFTFLKLEIWHTIFSSWEPARADAQLAERRKAEAYLCAMRYGTLDVP